ncbi:MAG TPA: hypothetical protein VMJ10_15440 [Kofleriaceae bacterium]|nr:hypothetical protein [Kofleriaceae bacterium]
MARRIVLLASLLWMCANAVFADIGTELSTAPGKFVAAINRKDVPAIRNYLHAPLDYRELWFADADCRRRFASAAQLDQGDLDAFAKCLATLHVERSTRSALGPYDIALTYDAGLEFEADFGFRRETGTSLHSIGFLARRGQTDASPTIMPGALESLRIAGTPLVQPDDTARAQLDAELPKLYRREAYAWLKVCMDDVGRVMSAKPRAASSRKASEAFVAGLHDWRFKPFMLNGRAMPFCSLVRLSYPARDNSHEELPFEPIVETEPMLVWMDELEPLRLMGDVRIKPPPEHVTVRHDPALRYLGPLEHQLDEQLAKQPHTRWLSGVFHVCIDVAGHVSSVSSHRGTGDSAYDAEIIKQISDWTYDPYLVDGNPIAVCTEAVISSGPLTAAANVLSE